MHFAKLTTIYFVKTYERLILPSLERKNLSKNTAKHKVDTLYQVLV